MATLEDYVVSKTYEVIERVPGQLISQERGRELIEQRVRKLTPFEDQVEWFMQRATIVTEHFCEGDKLLSITTATLFVRI